MKYPWEKWLSKKRFTLKKGKHFKCSLTAMAQQVRNNAADRELKVSVSTNDELRLLKVVVKNA